MALDAAGGDKRKMDFDVRRDCYVHDVKNFVFDLDVQKRTPKGELIVRLEKTADQLAEIEFQNQVYERLFRRIEKEKVVDSDETEESDSDQGMKKSLRDDWIQQQVYVKCQKETEFLWDAFTSGNAAEKHSQQKKQVEVEEQERQKKERQRKAEKDRKLNKFKKYQTRLQERNQELYYASDNSFKTDASLASKKSSEDEGKPNK